MQRRVLIGVDGSLHSDCAVKWYSNFIHQPTNEVLIVHVVNPTLFSRFGVRVTMGVSEDEFKEFMKNQHIKAAEHVQKYKAMCEELGLAAKIMVKEGHPAQELQHISETENCCMMIVGSRGIGPVRRAILGSVSEHLLHHLTIPVTICGPDKHDKHDEHDKHVKHDKHDKHDKHAKPDN